MTRPTPAEARKAIADIIGRSTSEALGLKESLEAERSALEQQDADSLQEVVISKNDRAENLQALDTERNALCESWGFTTGPERGHHYVIRGVILASKGELAVVTQRGHQGHIQAAKEVGQAERMISRN